MIHDGHNSVNEDMAMRFLLNDGWVRTRDAVCQPGISVIEILETLRFYMAFTLKPGLSEYVIRHHMTVDDDVRPLCTLSQFKADDRVPGLVYGLIGAMCSFDEKNTRTGLTERAGKFIDLRAIRLAQMLSRGDGLSFIEGMPDNAKAMTKQLMDGGGSPHMRAALGLGATADNTTSSTGSKKRGGRKGRN